MIDAITNESSITIGIETFGNSFTSHGDIGMIKVR